MSVIRLHKFSLEEMHRFISLIGWKVNEMGGCPANGEFDTRMIGALFGAKAFHEWEVKQWLKRQERARQKLLRSLRKARTTKPHVTTRSSVPARPAVAPAVRKPVAKELVLDEPVPEEEEDCALPAAALQRYYDGRRTKGAPKKAKKSKKAKKNKKAKTANAFMAANLKGGAKKNDADAEAPLSKVTRVDVSAPSAAPFTASPAAEAPSTSAPSTTSPSTSATRTPMRYIATVFKQLPSMLQAEAGFVSTDLLSTRQYRVRKIRNRPAFRPSSTIITEGIPLTPAQTAAILYGIFSAQHRVAAEAATVPPSTNAAVSDVVPDLPTTPEEVEYRLKNIKEEVDI
ncbi:hypothetical protein QR680_007067 [Steinernema hermaphroditum]|uniref:Uncharacterized protein n=1 Tax=Steinernema hermaphroditum TaxID=289476 RepID=A0AA39I013_9BILA|nr:hypothetical protein QR680_007067 [Steinernema hermaphroditum]